MTIQNPPIFIQAGSHPAEDVRRMLSSSVNDTPGIVATSDLAVSEKSGTPNMSVDVAGGRCWVDGTEATYQGMYFAENRGTANVVIAAADATNPRKDLVVVRVRDSAYSGGTDTVAIEVVTGTAAASPVDPALPDNSFLLARVDVAALASSIVNANITDLRTQTYALGADGGRGPYWQGRVSPGTVTGAFTTIIYATASTNASDIFSDNDPSPGVLKVLQSGIYHVQATINYYSAAAIGTVDTYTQLELVTTGAGVAVQSKQFAPGHYQRIDISYLWEAAANDIVYARHADAAFRSIATVGGAASQLQIARLGNI